MRYLKNQLLQGAKKRDLSETRMSRQKEPTHASLLCVMSTFSATLLPVLDKRSSSKLMNNNWEEEEKKFNVIISKQKEILHSIIQQEIEKNRYFVPHVY